MPAQQCPVCARFLKNDLVAGLVDDPAPCPKCGTTLTADMFAPAAESAVPPAATAPAPSVRPPDLEPGAVRDRPDVLAGWDADVPGGVVAVRDEPPFPTDTVVVLGAGVLGLLLGAVASDRAGRGATYGAVGGLVGAALARRIWRLP